MAATPSDDWTAYLNGTWAPLQQCTVPIHTHALQYGTGVFEGIRGYFDGERVSLLFLREHFQRLVANGRMCFMDGPSVDDWCAIAVKLISDNAIRQNCYVRPMLYKRSTNIGPRLDKEPDGALCYALPLDDYVDTENGLSCCITSWRRIADNAIPTRAKACGGYINSALARTEAALNGFDEAIFLNEHGFVSEGSAENVFIVRDGVLITPDLAADILEGITRAAVIGLARDLGIVVQERTISRTELYRCDECFLVGTGCQVSWVRAVDHRQIGGGTQGPITAQLQRAYEAAVYGRDASRVVWLTPC